jgi:dCMP deaminase
MNFDKYFHGLCCSVAAKSPCLSRNIGAILVKDNSVLSTGYNGPPRGIPHCKGVHMGDVICCPRHALGHASGTHMELCPAQHAEENAVSNAARMGTCISGSTLYMNSVIPCSKCFGTLINAGIKEIVIERLAVYDEHTVFLIDNCDIVIREFSNE